MISEYEQLYGFGAGGEILKLSELTAYAEEKFHIREQYKWADFPGFPLLIGKVQGKK